MEAVYWPLDHTDLTEQTYKVLKDRILRRQSRPGEKISVDEVAQKLGVSRTPVTDALKRLAGEGLVEIVPRRGTFVTELTTRDVTELFDIRMMTELYAAEVVLASGRVEQFLQEIKELMADMEQAVVNDDYGDYEAFIASDRDLHLTLVRLTGNQHLFRIYSGMNVHMQVARAHYLNSVEEARQAQREHETIVDAFRRRNLEEAKDALRAHISHVKARILEILDEQGGSL